MTIRSYRHLKDVFINEYESGKSMREISRIYNVNKTTVQKYVSEEVEIKRNGLSEYEMNRARELYISGMMVNHIAKELDRTHSTIKMFLSREFGVVTNGRRSYEHLVNDMKQDYMNGLSLSKIGLKYNISAQTVSNYISENGVKARNYSESARKYGLRESIFDEIDENKAFLLGKIFALGSVNKQSNCTFLDISIIKENEYLIESIAKELYTDQIPNYQYIGNTAKLRIPSYILTKRLLELGVYSILTSNSGDKLHKDIDPFKKSFFEGYFTAALKVYKKRVYIKFQNKYHLDIFTKHLKEDLDLVYFSRLNTCAIGVQSKAEVLKITKEYPFVMDKIKDASLRYEANNWDSIIINND